MFKSKDEEISFFFFLQPHIHRSWFKIPTIAFCDCRIQSLQMKTGFQFINIFDEEERFYAINAEKMLFTLCMDGSFY